MFDRVGVLIVTVIGSLIGLEIALASDIKLTPLVATLFPGLLVGVVVARAFGEVAGVITCAVSNGALYGLALYCWIRLATAIAHSFPIWLVSIAARLREW